MPESGETVAPQYQTGDFSVVQETPEEKTDELDLPSCTSKTAQLDVAQEFDRMRFQPDNLWQGGLYQYFKGIVGIMEIEEAAYNDEKRARVCWGTAVFEDGSTRRFAYAFRERPGGFGYVVIVDMYLNEENLSEKLNGQ